MAKIFKSLSNLPGWRTKHRFVVIESDDWGSIRMPSKESFKSMVDGGIDLELDAGFVYNKFDSLATNSDLEALYEVLSSMKDSTGRSVVLTPCAVVANPDFKKIRESDFSKYFYEPFTVTLSKYAECNDSYSFWKEGIEKRIFVPQFHGREHLNVKVWMKALKFGNRNALLAFQNGIWGISTASDPDIGLEFQAAFDFLDPADLAYHKEVIVAGLNLFEQLLGYRAEYFVPPNGPFSSKLENTCESEGIKYIFASKKHVEPLGEGKHRFKLNWLGKKSSSGIRYITRNCFFEPVQEGKDWIDNCLSEISTAFEWKKPAIISSHRVNFIGALYPENRDNGLRQLRKLLSQIIKKWPDVEFITTAELGHIIEND